MSDDIQKYKETFISILDSEIQNRRLEREAFSESFTTSR